MKEPPREENVRAAHGFHFPYWVMLAFSAYLFAFGPAVKLHRAVPQSQPAIEALYFWVPPLMRSSPHFAKTVEWYLFRVWRLK